MLASEHHTHIFKLDIVITFKRMFAGLTEQRGKRERERERKRWEQGIEDGINYKQTNIHTLEH